MINRNFTKNPNKKLFCDHFAQLRFRLTGEEVGKTEGIYYNDIYMGCAMINDIHKVKLLKLPTMTCLHATGKDKREIIYEYGELLNKLHLTEINPDVFIISYSYITINFNAYALPTE
jgi:hypothetical protein